MLTFWSLNNLSLDSKNESLCLIICKRNSIGQILWLIWISSYDFESILKIKMSDSSLNFCLQFEEQVKNCESYANFGNKLRERFYQDEYRRTHCLYFENALKLCNGNL